MGTYSTVLLLALVALSARLSAAAPSTAFTDVTGTDTLEPITEPTVEVITVTVPEVSVITEEPVTVPEVSIVTEDPVTATVPEVSIVTEDPATITVPDVSIVTEDPATVTIPDVSSVTDGSGEATATAGSDATDGTDATDGVTVSDGSGVTVTIPEGSGDCGFLVDLITIDKDTNSSLLTDAINEAWDSWDASFQAQFSSFKAEIEGIIFGSGVPCFADKLEKIATIIATWAADGSEAQKVVFEIYIQGWGQLKKLVDCVDDGDLGGSGELPGCEEGSGSGSGSGELPNCDDLVGFITIDESTNSTELTDAINDAFDSWSSSDKANFASYKQRIESIIWSDEFKCFEDKFEQIALVFSSWAPAGSDSQKLVYSIQIGVWGTIEDFVKCVDGGEIGGSGNLPGCDGSGSGSGDGGDGSGSGEGPNCDDIVGFITIDELTNSTDLTDAINEAFDSWDRISKANFNSYKKRIETLIWGDEFECFADKLKQIAQVLDNWAPDGSESQTIVYSIKIGSWGTIGDFVKCVNDGDIGGGEGELPGCGGEGSGSGSGDGGDGSGSGDGPSCDDIVGFITIDESNNSTDLTDAINVAFDTWDRNMKSNFNSYKKRIETLIWGDEFECFADKLEQIAIVLSNWAPDGSDWQTTVYSIKIGTWGTIGDFVRCVDDGDIGGGGSLPGCGGEGSGSGSGDGSGSGSGELPSCDDIVGLITVDESTNSTDLTDAINAAFDTWNRNMKANFNSYKKRIETLIWGDEFPCITDKLVQIAQVLDNWAPDGSSYQTIVFSIKIGSWGTIGDFVDCVDDGDYGSGSEDLPGCGTGSGSTVSDFTEEGSGATATIPGDNGLHCGQVVDLIIVDTTTNSTDLTDAINAAYDSWARIDKANFNSYKLRIETLIWGDEFPCSADKLKQIAQVLDNWAPDGSEDQAMVYSIQIGTWGTIEDFVKCVNGGSNDASGSWTPPPCEIDVSTVAPEETTTAGPTGPDCAQAASFITIDTATNTTILTTAINTAYNSSSWTRTDRGNFNSYKKRIETLIWGNEFTTSSDKLDGIATVLEGYAPEGSAASIKVMSIQIGTWGTIQDLVNCANTW